MPLSFERTKNYNLIRSIVSHPEVYKHVADDFSPKREDWVPIENDAVFYLLVKDGEEVLGVFTLVPHNAICWEVHTCFLPSAWGPRIKDAGRGGHEWIFANTECRRITTEVPEYNRIALRYAKQNGMEQYGVNPKSFMKTGTLHDVILLGVSK